MRMILQTLEEEFRETLAAKGRFTCFLAFSVDLCD